MIRGARVPAGSRHRIVERQLLALAILVIVFAYVLVGAAQSGGLLRGALVFAGTLVALALVVHLAVRRFAPVADPLFLPTAFLVNGIGLVLIRRLDFANGTQLASAQSTWTVVGIGVFALVIIAVPDHRRLTRYRYTAGLAALALIVLPLVPGVGYQVNGAQLWVKLGPVGFQPGEFAKLGIVVFLAGYLDQKRALLSVATTRVGPFLVPAARHLAPVLFAALGAIGVLVLQRDLGSSLLFFGVFVVMLYIATGRVAYPTIGLLAFAAGAVAAYMVFSHVRVRFDIWLDPWSDIDGKGYQLAQSLFALGTGGLTGTGLGLGHPEIPEAATDAIFAVLGEELGLLGTTAVLVCFLVMVVRGYKTALTSRDEVGALLAAGLASIIALQTFVIVGGVTRLVPFTGLTLPFVSYGGSSLVANYLLLALLVRVSDAAAQTAVVGVEAAA